MSHTAWRSKYWECNIGINTPWSAPALAFEQVHAWWLLRKRLTTTSVNSLPCNNPKQPTSLPYFQVFISPKLSFQFPVVFAVDVETLLVPKCLRLPLSAHTPEKLVSSDENFAEGMFEVGASALANDHHQVNLSADHCIGQSLQRTDQSSRKEKQRCIFCNDCSSPYLPQKCAGSFD